MRARILFMVLATTVASIPPGTRDLLAQPPSAPPPTSSPPVGGDENLDDVVSPLAEARSAAARERLDQLRELNEKSPQQLAALARASAARVAAELTVGRALAKFEVRERNLEAIRLESLAAIEQCEKQITQIRADLAAEAAQIQEQFADDAAEKDRQVLGLVALNKPKLAQLQADIEQRQARVKRTSGELSVVRSQLNALKLRRRETVVLQSPPSVDAPLKTADPKEHLKLIDELGVDDKTLDELVPDVTSPSDRPPVDAAEELRKLLEPSAK